MENFVLFGVGVTLLIFAILLGIVCFRLLDEYLIERKLERGDWVRNPFYNHGEKK